MTELLANSLPPCLPVRDHKKAIHINLLPSRAVHHYDLHVCNEVRGVGGGGGVVSGRLLCMLKRVFPLMEALALCGRDAKSHQSESGQSAVVGRSGPVGRTSL